MCNSVDPAWYSPTDHQFEMRARTLPIWFRYRGRMSLSVDGVEMTRANKRTRELFCIYHAADVALIRQHTRWQTTAERCRLVKPIRKKGLLKSTAQRKPIDLVCDKTKTARQMSQNLYQASKQILQKVISENNRFFPEDWCQFNAIYSRNLSI